MKSKITKNLFREIIDCPRVMSASGQCSSIISLQNRCNFQVPEPWNGDIENAKILILGLNPALDVAELFPSYDLCSRAWNVRCAKGYKWTDSVVKTFFENRYSACCPQCGLQYADVDASPFYEGNFTSLVIGEGVASIGNYAFSYCSVLQSVTIPSSVKSIDSRAFYNCGELSTVYCYPKTPPVIRPYAFDGCSLDNIYVPYSSANAYREKWSTYNTIITGKNSLD